MAPESTAVEKVYEATEEDRRKLRDAHGELIGSGEKLRERLEQEDRKIVCVGDRVSLATRDSDIDAYIVDGREQREDLEEDTAEILEAGRRFQARNPAGTVTGEAWRQVAKALAVDCTSVLDIEGEEDLLALPAVVMLPDDALVVYGLRNKGAVIMEVSEVRELVESILEIEREEKAIVGGSWRFFHAGHSYLLLRALERAAEIDVGVTSDRMLREKLGHEPGESFEERRKHVEEFLEEYPVSTRVVEIDDIYGNAVEEGDRLVVTPETRPNADRINRKRREQGNIEMEVDVVEKLEAGDGGPVSSTRIEEEVIDRDGRQRELL